MNDEISRILKLLEDGKVTADEAERLIRTITQSQEAGTERTRRSEGDACEPGAVWRALRGTLRAVARAQRRSAWWQYFWTTRRAAEARRKRAAEMTVGQRVEFLLVECGLADRDDLSPAAKLDGDLGCSCMSRQLLRYALEDEFGITITNDEANGFATVADVVACVEERVGAQPSPEPEAADGPQVSPAPA